MRTPERKSSDCPPGVAGKQDAKVCTQLTQAGGDARRSIVINSMTEFREVTFLSRNRLTIERLSAE
jgi:hypothetical protein